MNCGIMSAMVNVCLNRKSLRPTLKSVILFLKLRRTNVLKIINDYDHAKKCGIMSTDCSVCQSIMFAIQNIRCFLKVVTSAIN